MSQLVERKGYKIESTSSKKKKNKDKQTKSKIVEHVQIIDDDALIPWNNTETISTTTVKKSKKLAIEHVPEKIVDDELISAEDAPVIVGVIDERPADVREKERFENAKRWRTAAFEEVPKPSSIGPQSKPTKSSRQKQKDSDDSDPDIDRRQSAKTNDPDLSPPRRKSQPEDNDSSPPRRRRRSSNEDPSPSRRKRNDSSPPRRKNHATDRDSSPSRRQKDNDSSPPRRRRQPSNDDPSPPRRKRDDSSPPRRKTHAADRDSSPPRRKQQSDDDRSPPRRKKNNDSSPPRRRQPSNDDPSPPRRKRDDSSPPRRKKHDDPSPPRRKHQDRSSPRQKHKHRDDSSPPRHRDRSSPSSSRRRNDERNGRESSPSSTHRHRPKEEPSTPSSSHRRPKEESPPPSNQPAKSQRRRLAEQKEQVADRYAQWGRGLAQVRQKEEAVQDYLEQAEKPLARYRDDQDLDAMLKQREREDDPMLKYLTNKTSDTGDRSTNSNKPPPKPRYKGPEPQKNRFNIWPGYRWDGVDRSNGYEKKLFESIASRHAKAQEAYLWSVEDM